MLFNSLEYLFFLPIVFAIYWLVQKRLWLQNLFVVIASYVFYGWWDWRFLLLIAFTSLCSWLSGILIARNKTEINIASAAINIDKQDNPKKYKENTESSIDTYGIPNNLDHMSSQEQVLISPELERLFLGQPSAQSCSIDSVAQTLSDDSEKNTKNIFSAKFWLIANIVLNLGILAIFKYYDFFVSEFGAMLGINTSSLLLRVMLPVGISFYTFQALSYSIDVYRGNIKPTKDIIAFFAFISFFPQLVAGPIERATNLLPQFLQKRKFSYEQGVDGLRQIVWGLFKKIVIADNCATYVDQVWSSYGTQSGSTLLLAAVLFAFQIYGDFSGYSDIAIGTAKLFGIRLMRNFNNPYFSRDIAEFWRRWHISLTSWFRDYVYIPLGGSRPKIDDRWIDNRWTETSKKFIIIRNTVVVFLLCAIWHGANWTYVMWGLYHVVLFVPLIIMNRTHRDKSGESRVERREWRDVWRILLTFVLVTIGWIIFRAPTVADVWGYVSTMCTAGWGLPYITDYTLWVAIAMIGVMIGFEWHYRNTAAVPFPRNIWASYILIAIIWWFAGQHTADFIYFQF